MRAIATIYIPYAQYHIATVQRAVVSAYAQTRDVIVIPRESPGSPAVHRNAALQASTPFVVWLDADDRLAPTFVEDCLWAYEEGKYVYTNWYEGETQYKPKPCAWSGDSHHIVTTLYPTEIFKALGGFDESLPGHEDAEFYMRSYANRVCGTHLDKALVTRPDHSGQRSILFHKHPDYHKIIEQAALKNGGMNNIMACCGQPSEAIAGNPGEELPGDVVAEALWDGTRSEFSPYTNRIYRGGNRGKLFVSPTDVLKFPDKFRQVNDPRQLAPKREQVLRESGLV